MKNLVLAASAMALVSMAYAGEGCTSSVGEKSADGKSEAVCTMGAKVACSEAEAVNMAKGGAENVAMGYGVGQKVPDFSSADTNGKTHTLSEYAGKPVMVVFYNQRCPFVKEVMGGLDDFTKTYEAKGVKVLGIDSGVNNKPEEIAAHAKEHPYTILVNQESNLARDFGATHTPQVFLLDKEGVIVYTGAFQVTEDDGSVTNYAQKAIDAVMAGQPVEKSSTKAFGCTIKFNPDTEKKAQPAG